MAVAARGVRAELAAAAVADAGTFTNPVIAVDWPDPAIWNGGDGWYYSVATGLRTIHRVELSADGLSVKPVHVAGVRRPADKMKHAWEGSYLESVGTAPRETIVKRAFPRFGAGLYRVD